MAGQEGRYGIDWPAVHDRLNRRNAALEEIFAGRGAWAHALLDRRAEELAREPAAGSLEAALSATPLLIARGAEARYGLDLRHLAQVVALPRVARVPGATPAVLGLIAVGGRVMRLFDLDRLCGGQPWVGGETGTGGHAVVLRTASRRPAALRVSAVERVADLSDAGTTELANGNALIRGLTADRVAVLDMDVLLAAVTAD